MKKNLTGILFKPLIVALLLVSMFTSCIAPRHGGGRPPAPPGMPKH